MVDMYLEYNGEKNCQLTHGPSNKIITTDAPVDNNGRGESFSPTDLFSSSLAACMVTIISIQLEKEGFDVSGTKAKITKHMASNPRRVSQIDIALTLGKGIPRSLEERVKEICRNCPVHLSISKDITVNLSIDWSVG